MMIRLKQFLFIALLLGAAPLSANEPPSSWVMAEIDRDAATEVVRKKQPGRILEVKTRMVEGKEVHVVKILTNGDRVKQYIVDAESGKIVGNE